MVTAHLLGLVYLLRLAAAQDPVGLVAVAIGVLAHRMSVQPAVEMDVQLEILGMTLLPLWV